MKMKTGKIGLSRGLPKTTQVTSYRDGDDGYYEAGWWRGLSFADNRDRFIPKTIDGDDVIIDLATGLVWAADGNEAGCNNGGINNWNDAIDYAEALDFAGFTDWRVPNMNELLSIIDYSRQFPCAFEPPFANTANDEYWSSTTNIGMTATVVVVGFAEFAATTVLKTATHSLRCVRGGL